ncbi:MAG: sulfatase [Spirochaetes bacterium]|nr:sulfatase [Spirochaetota bacterium]
MDNKRPNVIWIFGDQHRAQALSINGDPNVNTPNIDALGTMGINFTNAVAGFPLCCPFRGALLSGKYPHTCVPGHEYQLDPNERTIAHVFNDSGYRTAYFGKWHLDGFHEREGRAAKHLIPKERRGGFQEWVGYENNNSQWDSWVHGHRGNGDEVPLCRLNGYETDELTDMLIDYIERSKNCAEPFFAVLSVQPPHDPYAAPPEYMKRHNPQSLRMRPNVPSGGETEAIARRELAGAYAMIENLDHNVGRVMQCLRDRGVNSDTHIIFFSDHGDMHGSHGMFRKTNPFEESIRIPFIIGGEKMMRYDNRGTGNTDAVANAVDIAPTTLGLCGIERPSWMCGHDYSYLRVRDGKPHQEPVSAYIQSVIPTGHGDSIDKPWRGVVTRDGWKYAAFEGISWLMFNLNEDPYELTNLAHNQRFAAKRKELIGMTRDWIGKTGDTFTLPAE